MHPHNYPDPDGMSPTSISSSGTLWDEISFGHQHSLDPEKEVPYVDG